MQPTKLFTIGAFIAMSLSLGACSATTDLGRSPSNLAGSEYVQASTGDDAAELAITAEEQELHRRLYRFQDIDTNDNWVAKVMRQARINSIAKIEEEDYFEWIIKSYGTSSQAAFTRIDDDARRDILALSDVFRLICTVQKTDENRLRAAQDIPSTPEATHLAVKKRRDDNMAKVESAVLVLDFRYNSYSYALEQMLVQAPSERARSVDATLSELAIFVGQANANAYCQSPGSGTTIPSRYAADATMDLTAG